MPHKTKDATVAVTGRVARLFYESDNFSAGVLHCNDGTEVRFNVKGRLATDQDIQLTGVWEDSKYGVQLKATMYRIHIAATRQGLINWLAASKDFPGIGPAKARALVEAFGESFEDTLLNSPATIADTAGIDLSVAEQMRDAWQANAVFNSVAAKLADYGLTPKQIETLYNHYGCGLLNVLKNDPYVIAKNVDGYGFKRVDAIALKMGTSKTHPGRLQAGLVWLVQEAHSNGHSCIEYENLVQDAVGDALKLDGLDAYDQVNKAFNSAIDNGLLSMYEYGRVQYVTTPGAKNAEEIICAFLSRARDLPPALTVDPSVVFGTDVANGHIAALTDEQRAAINHAFRHPVSVITGGAGVGKTYTVKKICDAAKICGIKEIALCAPTGKAARRMAEIDAGEASTIHRLLEFMVSDKKKDENGNTVEVELVGNFARHAGNKLDAQLIIVDEFSMCDSWLCSRLFDAIDLSRTIVVLVGDHNQLPPVGAGFPFRDIIQHRMVPVTHLTAVQRAAGPIKANSMAILDGVLRDTEKSSESEWHIANLSDPNAIADCVIHAMERIQEREKGNGAFNLFMDVQVLTPMKKGVIGVNTLNNRLQAWAHTCVYKTANFTPTEGDKRPPFYVGDKVMQTRNNYSLGVMNGTQGIVVSIDTTDKKNQYMVVNFDGVGEVKIIRDFWSDVSLAYAMTIHKSQGSEYRYVLVICHRSHFVMLHRNLLYTGVTRARFCALIIGDAQGRNTAVKTVQVDKRMTMLPMLWDDMMADAIGDNPTSVVDEPETAGVTAGVTATTAKEMDDDDDYHERQRRLALRASFWKDLEG